MTSERGLGQISRIYSKKFFQDVIKDEEESSFATAKILKRYFKPSSVIDIGCGCGIYLFAFSKINIKDIAGFDGSRHSIEESRVPEKITLFDLREPLKISRKYDLCLCFEVAEHIEKKYSETLIESLTSVSDTIVFTAAVPGQGGTDHINEQPYSFWISIFEKKRFYFDAALSKKLRTLFKRRRIIWWLVNNLMIFRKKHDYTTLVG